MEGPQISRIRIYPVKSLDPIELDHAEVGTYGLKDDRSFAMFANDGRLINGKRTGLVNSLKAEYDLEQGLITLSKRDELEKESFQLREGNSELEAYLAAHFDMKVSLVHDVEGGLQDVPKRGSVSIVTEATLRSLQEDLKMEDLENLRLRFRANLEISGVEAYWEDRLFNAPGKGVKFSIGDVEMIGICPRIRCSVPPRNPFTGEPEKYFAKAMMASREKHLPSDSHLYEYGNSYHLCVDTYISPQEKGKVIRLGDEVKPWELLDDVSPLIKSENEV
jgi:uncharacterized protein